VIVAVSTSVGPHVFWITSRAAGIAALVLSSASVGVGLLIGRRAGAGKGRGGDFRALHEALSLATLVAIAVHGAALLGDHFLHPTIVEISVPFTSTYRSFWTGLGTAAGWAMVVLGFSYYARARIGVSRWRALHRFTAAFWALGIVHSLGAGTDAGQPWFLLALIVSVGPPLVLLVGRLARKTESRPPSERADGLDLAAVVNE
jgi:sulfoxide reductase heme-binding subunit YedZ